MLDERRRTPALEAPVSESRPDAGVNMPAGVSLAIGAIVVVQVGHSLAVLLLERVGVMTSAAFRAGFSALILVALVRPVVRSLNRAQLILVAVFGINLAVMSLALFMAISRIPLGVALAIAFLGPLGIAILQGKRLRDLACAVTALAGVVLLVELPGASIEVDPLGILGACLAAVSWASYIFCSKRAMAALPRLQGLALAMCVSAAVLIPAAVIVGPASAITMGDVGLGLATAVLATALPFSMESLSLRLLPINAFGILMSLEPAVAATAGFLLLGQDLATSAVAGIALVVLASIGATTGRSPG